MTVFSRPSRRGFLGLTITALAIPLAGPAAAFNESDARALIDRVVSEINQLILSGGSDAQIIRSFEGIMARYGDMGIIAQSVMGADWRRATASQRRDFTSAFQSYMARKYGRQFRAFIGGRIEVQSARPNRNYFEVVTTAYFQGQTPFEMRFHVSNLGGRERFFNIIIAGVNIRLVERNEIGNLLDRNGGDIDAMIAALRQAG